jgi:hypothetical protein
MFKLLFSRIFKKKKNPYQKIFNGEVKPPNIPENWIGEALLNSEGWSWKNPNNFGDSVKIYRENPPYVVVTKNGIIIGQDGKPIEK